MPLCGSSKCGCAIVSTPATSGGIDGALPTIDVDGAGTPESPWDLTLNSEWVTGLLANLAGLKFSLQAGKVTVPSAAATTSIVNVVFPEAFTAAPIFVCNLVSSGGIYCATGGSVNTTDADIYTFRTDGANVAASRVVHWIAVEILA